MTHGPCWARQTRGRRHGRLGQEGGLTRRSSGRAGSAFLLGEHRCGALLDLIVRRHAIRIGDTDEIFFPGMELHGGFVRSA